MTICIAAGCEIGTSDPGIILCTDWKVSSSLGAAETKLKGRWLGRGFYCLTAGYDSDINATYQHLWNEFTAQKEIDETNVVETIRRALRLRRREKIEEFIQGRFSISYDDFLNHGKSWLPSDLFNATSSDVAAIKLNAAFVVAGFTPGGRTVLCETTDIGAVALKEDIALVGEGKFLSSAALYHRAYMDVKPIGEALYLVYEAKKYAERVASVGSFTWLKIFRKNDRLISLTDDGMSFLEEQYKKYGPQYVGRPIIDPSFMEG